MTPPEPWPAILAAYADGELAPADRAAVERWLAAHPEDRELLRAQWELSPRNERFRTDRDPPLPSSGEWAAVRAAVAARVLPATAGRSRRWAWVAGAAAAALAVGAVAWLAAGPRPGPAPVVAPAPEVARTPAPSAEVVRPVPSPIETVQAIPAEDDPLAGSLTLAAEGDVVVEAMGPHPVWPGGMPPMTTAPGDAPMIFAAAR